MTEHIACSATLAISCTGEALGFFTLGIGRRVLALCPACRDYAESIGLDPRPVSAWVARAAMSQLPVKVTGGRAA